MSNKKTVIFSFLFSLIVVALLICADNMNAGAQEFVSSCVKAL